MEPSPENCPSCGVSLPPGAVLCIACGYHLKLGRHLATSVGEPRPQIDRNPYASPDEIEQRSPPGYVADLTDEGARKAKAIVSDAENVYAALLFAWCCCGPAWFLLLPWYGWRLYSWYKLNNQFYELRYPNGFSPHGELAGSFQDSKFKLWVGVVAGGIFFVLVLLATVFDLARYLGVFE